MNQRWVVEYLFKYISGNWSRSLKDYAEFSEDQEVQFIGSSSFKGPLTASRTTI